MKKSFTKGLNVILVTTLLLMGTSSLTMATGSNTIKLDIIDTIAGYTALARISNAPQNCKMELKIEKPDHGQFLIETKVDEYGKSKVDIESYYTKKAGDYLAWARCKDRDEEFGNSTTFKVYAGNTSPHNSIVEMSRKTAPADGNTPVLISAYLKDNYGNAIGGHEVKLIAGRNEDEVINTSSSYTDRQGKVNFSAYSHKEGIGSFIVYDTTESLTLNERPEIAFYTPPRYSNAIGGHEVKLATSSSGPVNYLAIEELPESVKVGQILNFTVTAYDSQQNQALDYTGEVRFSSSDDNASLPNDYQFEGEDQGSHTFSLSLSFKTAGIQTLMVTDLDDVDIYGEIEMEVISEGTGSSSITTTGSNSSSTSSATGDLTISSPLSGTYSSDKLTFSGKAMYGLSVQIFDNDQSVGETEVNSLGEYEKEITNLKEGLHPFIVTTVNSEDQVQDTSEEILITIDITAPQIDKIEVSPEGTIPAGETFIVTVYTEPQINASVIFNNAIFDLVEDELINGMYEATLIAPEALGEYDLDVLLIDEIGNEGSYENEMTLTISENTTSDQETSDEFETLPVEENATGDPGTVTGLQATSGNGEVTLTWETPVDGDEDVAIDFYRIYYGPVEDPELMLSVENTADSSPSWTMELPNGSTYYFNVVAVNTEGNESTTSSEIVSATGTPKEEELLAAALESEEAENIENDAENDALETAMDEEDTPDTGPEILWLIALSIGFSHFYFKIKKPYSHPRFDI